MMLQQGIVQIGLRLRIVYLAILAVVSSFVQAQDWRANDLNFVIERSYHSAPRSIYSRGPIPAFSGVRGRSWTGRIEYLRWITKNEGIGISLFGGAMPFMFKYSWVYIDSTTSERFTGNDVEVPIQWGFVGLTGNYAQNVQLADRISLNLMLGLGAVYTPSDTVMSGNSAFVNGAGRDISRGCFLMNPDKKLIPIAVFDTKFNFSFYGKHAVFAGVRWQISGINDIYKYEYRSNLNTPDESKGTLVKGIGSLGAQFGYSYSWGQRKLPERNRKETPIPN